MNKACPECGGDTGYFYKITVEYQQWNTWDGEQVNAKETGNGNSGKIAECHDCGFRFRREKNYGVLS